ncbi:hypothetical protein BDZ89DRAFT_1046325 [Hymenopellis radicata]|nr:hypothetical protein BDZ89DRAFT_1046325 [Hymenopellis radicata]
MGCEGTAQELRPWLVPREGVFSHLPRERSPPPPGDTDSECSYDEDAESKKYKGRAPIGAVHGMTNVKPEQIAYAAGQAAFALSGVKTNMQLWLSYFGAFRNCTPASPSDFYEDPDLLDDLEEESEVCADWDSSSRTDSLDGQANILAAASKSCQEKTDAFFKSLMINFNDFCISSKWISAGSNIFTIKDLSHEVDCWIVGWIMQEYVYYFGSGYPSS